MAKRRDPRSETSSIVGPTLRALAMIPGVLAERLQTGGGLRRIRGASAGTPDILVVIRGRALFLEAKKPGGKLEPKQLEWRERCFRAGGDVFVIESVRMALDVVREALAR